MDVSGILAACVSHAETLGVFETPVNTHEPRSRPTAGMTCAMWVQTIKPLPAASGLNSTTGYVTLMVRLYSSALQQPYDAIDPALMTALDALFTGYSGAFTLGGKVRNVDLLGEHGTALSGQAGYLTQDGEQFRIFDITLPLVVNDLWPQVK